MHCHRHVLAWLLPAALLALAGGCDDGGASRAAARPARLLDLDGAVVTIEDAMGPDAAVFIFVRSDCPISNKYAPEIQRLHASYAERGVRFWLVYPDPKQTPDAIRAHLEAYQFPCDPLRDPDHSLVKQTGATVTPEAAVFTRDGAMAYCGRIDDLYVRLGTARQAPTTHDLADALDAVLDGRPVREARTKAVGCYIADVQ